MRASYILRAGTLVWTTSGWSPRRSAATPYASLSEACGARADLASDRDVCVVKVVGAPSEGVGEEAAE